MWGGYATRARGTLRTNLGCNGRCGPRPRRDISLLTAPQGKHAYSLALICVSG